MSASTVMDLQEGEELLRRGRMHAGVLLMPLLAALAFMGMLVPIYLLPQPFIRALQPSEKTMLEVLLVWPLGIAVGMFGLLTTVAFIRAEIVLTNTRVRYRTGRFAGKKGEVALEDIEGIFLLRPAMGRLFNYGTVGLTVLGGAHVPILFVPRPQAFLNDLKGATKLAKLRTGEHYPRGGAVGSEAPRSQRR